MQLILYSLLDTCDGHYELILTSQTDETMKRVLVSQFISGKQTPITENYEDKQLFRIGSMDTSNGVITPLPAPLFIVTLTDIYEIALAKVNKWKKEHGISEESKDGKESTKES